MEGVAVTAAYIVAAVASPILLLWLTNMSESLTKGEERDGGSHAVTVCSRERS
jgi:hypothetical protein